MNNEANIRFYGSEEDGVYVAPVGTTYELNLDALGPEYKGLGLLGEDGIEEEIETELAEHRVHQGFKIARSKVTGAKHTFKVIGSENNPVVKALRHPGMSTETVGGVNVTRGLEKIVRDERQVVIDTYDGDIKSRRIHTRAEVTERATLSRKANEATLYEFTFTSYGEIIDIDNDPAFTVEVTP